jgi:hypothetical protein
MAKHNHQYANCSQAIKLGDVPIAQGECFTVPFLIKLHV